MERESGEHWVGEKESAQKNGHSSIMDISYIETNDQGQCIGPSTSDSL